MQRDISSAPKAETPSRSDTSMNCPLPSRCLLRSARQNADDALKRPSETGHLDGGDNRGAVFHAEQIEHAREGQQVEVMGRPEPVRAVLAEGRERAVDRAPGLSSFRTS